MFAAFLGTLSLLFSFGSTNIQSYICQPPDKPSITQPADASSVTEGAVTVSGIATASSLVTISVDNQAAAQVTADAYNTFAGQITLTPGVHSLALESDSPCGNSSGDPIAVIVTPAPVPPPVQTNPASPVPGSHAGSGSASNTSAGGATTPTTSTGLGLRIVTPRPDSRVTGASVYVSGTTSEPAIIHIFVGDSERAKTFTAASTFGLTVPLPPGTSTILVQAVAGTDQASESVTVTRINAPRSVNPVDSTPWWQTVPGIITIGALLALVVGLIIWIRR